MIKGEFLIMNQDNFQNFDGEENTTPVEETTEVTEEEVTEETFDAVEDTADEEAEAETPEFEEIKPFEEITAPEKKKSNAGIIALIVVLIVAILGVGGFCVFKYLTRNPYNNMGYINVSGRTIQDVADAAGMSLDEFLADYGLPADMPADTEEAAAFYNIPVSKIAEMYGMDMATIKEMLGLGDDVTDDTTWGEAEGKAPLSKYVGESNLESFKEQYELGDDVTGDTLWGEVRNIVDQKTLELEKAAEEAEADADATDGEADDNSSADTETEE